MYYPHMVQAGVGPFQTAPGYPQPHVTSETLSVAVAVKGGNVSEQMLSNLKQETGPQQTPGTQPNAQFNSPILSAPQGNNATSGVPTLPLQPPVGTMTKGIEQQTVSISDLLQQTEPEPGPQSTTTICLTSDVLKSSAPVSSATSQTPLVNTISSQSICGITPNTVTSSTSTALVPLSAASSDQKNQPKRLHVSNIPFRFRDPDLRAMFGQFGPILDVEIIFNERGSKGFGFVTFANSSDAERARERLHGTVVEGRKIEVNNATARVQTKKAPTVPNVYLTKQDAVAAPGLVLCKNESYHQQFGNLQTAAALRGVAIQRGRARAAFPAAAAAAAAFAARFPAPLAAAANAANALHGYTPVYYDPFLAAAAATADPNYRLQAAAPLLKTPLSTAQQAYAAAATYTVAARAAYGAAAAAQPVAGYAAVSGYGREYADPYLGHGIGPVPGYGAAMYRSGYNRFTPY